MGDVFLPNFLCVDVSVNFGFYCKCVGSFEHLGLGHSFVWVNPLDDFLVQAGISLDFHGFPKNQRTKPFGFGILLGFLLVASISALLRNEPDMASYSAWVLRTADLVPCGRKVKISDQDRELAWLFSLLCWKFEGFQHIRIIGLGLKSRRPEMTIFQYVIMTDL